MSSRDATAIRQEIAAERKHLDEELSRFERELLSGVPLLLAGLVLAAVVFTRRRHGRKKPRPTGITISWKLK